MLSLQEARRRIVAPLQLLETERVNLREAVNRVLAGNVAACVAHPQEDVSAMDGYAVRMVDTTHGPITLEIVAQSTAGHPATRGIGSGEAARIFTGAVIPPGADSVVLQEDAVMGPHETVIVSHPTILGSNIRPAGSDFHVGDVLLRAGRRLSFRDIALAAAMNVPCLAVIRRPRVAVLSTGDEVCLPGENLGQGQLVDANGFALSALITSYGGVPIDLGIARDNRTSLRAQIRAARGADLLIISGGVSVGDHDLVRKCLREAGMVLDFWKVAVRPGKPLLHGHLDGMPVIGVPGNPVSAMVSAILFVLPALNTLLGLPVTTGMRRHSGVLNCNLPANDSREDYLRAVCVCTGDNMIHVTPFSQQDSSMLSILSAANCLAIRPPHAPPAYRGHAIEIIALEPCYGPSPLDGVTEQTPHHSGSI